MECTLDCESWHLLTHVIAELNLAELRYVYTINSATNTHPST